MLRVQCYWQCDQISQVIMLGSNRLTLAAPIPPLHCHWLDAPCTPSLETAHQIHSGLVEATKHAAAYLRHSCRPVEIYCPSGTSNQRNKFPIIIFTNQYLSIRLPCGSLHLLCLPMSLSP